MPCACRRACATAVPIVAPRSRAFRNNLIEPFLSQPMVVDADELAECAAHRRHAGRPRDNVGRGDAAYARGVSNDAVENYHVFRPARPLFDPDDANRKMPIAYEAFYLGTRPTWRERAAKSPTLRIQ